MEHAPFTRPLRLVPDGEAWTMPPCAPGYSVWDRFDLAVPMLDVRGVHRLLHAASLPEAELRHMGAGPAMLLHGRSCPSLLSAVAVAPVLGRIVLDAAFNVVGGRWTGSAVHWAMAWRYGEDVIEEFFS